MKVRRAVITADNITDDQIRALMEEAWTLYAHTCRALGFSPINGTKYADPDSAREHRARCAEILNAREEIKPHRLHGAATNTSMHVGLVHAPDIKGLAFVDAHGTRCCTVLEGEIANVLDAANKIAGYDGELPCPCPHLRKV